MTRQMKDSGVEWIGEIPEKWNAKKFKYIFSIIGGNGFPENLQGNCNGDYPFFKCSDINGTEREVLLAKNFVNSNIVDKYKFNIIPSDSILMAKIGEALKKNHRKINKKPCIVDNNMQALVFKSYECLMYYHYLSTILDMMWFDNGGTIPSVNNVKLKNFLLPNPPLSEQKAIADYLDDRCGKIDDFIAKQKAVIEKLKEYKQSVITEAVTKGLNPAAPMKSSGVEWIGDIPEKWDVRKLFQVFTQVKNKNQGMTETNLLSLSYGKIKQKNIETSFGLLPESFETYNIIEKNNIVLRLTDLQNDQKSFRVGLSTQRGIITSAYVTMRAKDSRMAPYLYYLLHTFDIEKGFYGMGDGVRQGLNWDELKKLLSLVLPPLSEQKEIADYLDAKCAEIDAFITKKQTVIEKLTEYKKSLIYECVTGKRDVA